MSDLATRVSQALTVGRAMERALNDPHARWEMEYDGQRTDIVAVYQTDHGVSFSAEFCPAPVDGWLTLCVDGDSVLSRPVALLRSAPADEIVLSIDLTLEGEPAEAA